MVGDLCVDVIRMLRAGGNLSSRAPNPEPRAPSPEPRAPNPESRVPSPSSEKIVDSDRSSLRLSESHPLRGRFMKKAFRAASPILLSLTALATLAGCAGPHYIRSGPLDSTGTLAPTLGVTKN